MIVKPDTVSEARKNAEKMLQMERMKTFERLLLFTASIATVALIIFYLILWNRNDLNELANIVLLVVLWGAYFLPLRFGVKGAILVGFLYVTGIFILMGDGPRGDTRLIFLVAVLCVKGFFGGRAGLGMIMLTTLTFLMLGIFSDAIPSELMSEDKLMVSSSVVIVNSVSYLFFCLMGYWVMRFINRALEEALVTQLMVSAELAQKSNELEIALTTEKELNELRTKLITSLSHNFRTPLTVIQNSATLINQFDGQLSAEKKQSHFQNINSNVERLTDLTDYILMAKPTDSAELDQLISEMP